MSPPDSYRRGPFPFMREAPPAAPHPDPPPAAPAAHLEPPADPYHQPPPPDPDKSALRPPAFCPCPEPWNPAASPGRPAWIADHQLAAAAFRLAQLLPPTVGLVAAVPRSGFPLAALVAMHRHLPLAELHPQTGLRYCQHGYRYQTGTRPDPHGQANAVAVIDDTVAGGTSLATLTGTLAALRSTGRPVYTAVGFCNPELTHLVDFHAQPLALPHFLAWNFWNSCHADNLATDLDGILCPDYAGAADDEGPAYWQHLHAAPALAWPGRRPLAAIVTARLEKYRGPTAAWLRRHGIRHEALVMAPQATARERSAHLDPGAYKAAWYGQSTAALFVESCPHQAAKIADLTRRPVLCPPAGLAWNI